MAPATIPRVRGRGGSATPRRLPQIGAEHLGLGVRLRKGIVRPSTAEEKRDRGDKEIVESRNIGQGDEKTKMMHPPACSFIMILSDFFDSALQTSPLVLDA